MDATCTIQDSIHVFSLVHKYVSRILGTYQYATELFEYLKNVLNIPAGRVFADIGSGTGIFL